MNFLKAFVQFEANTICRKSVMSEEKVLIYEGIRRNTRKMLRNAQNKMAGT